MRLLFCGVRGSTPAPGAEFVRVGGHTSCVALAHEDEPWSLLLDAGTGIRRVTAELGGSPFTGTLLLTHLHWDHVQGLPFFGAGDRDDARVRVLMPDQGGSEPADVLARAMSPPHFPIGPDGLRGDWRFDALTAGAHEIEGFEVTAFDVPHKGGRTFGFRVADAHGSLAYVPDHHPEADSLSDVVRACRGVDLLVHDAQFVERERAVADAYGHATVDDAVDLARRAGVRTLALFHHSPARGDDEVEAIGRAAEASGLLAAEASGLRAAEASGVRVIVAREEVTVEIGAGATQASVQIR